MSSRNLIPSLFSRATVDVKSETLSAQWSNVPSCADKAAARPRPDGNRDVIEEYGAGGIPDKTRKLGKRWPRGGSVWLLAVAGRLRRSPGIRRDRCSKMHNVPLDRTQRELMIHMDVIEQLDMAGLNIFDQRIVWASKIPKTSLARRGDSFGAQFENLFLRRQSGQ